MSKAKTRYPLRDNGFQWSCYPDLNWRPHPYQLIPHPRNASIRCFGGIFVPENRRQWCFPLHCLRPLVSCCGSSCGSWGNGLNLLEKIGRNVTAWLNTNFSTPVFVQTEYDSSRPILLPAQHPQASLFSHGLPTYCPTKYKRPHANFASL